MTPRRVLLSIIRAKRPPQEVERAIRAVGALAAQMRREAEPQTHRQARERVGGVMTIVERMQRLHDYMVAKGDNVGAALLEFQLQHGREWTFMPWDERKYRGMRGPHGECYPASQALAEQNPKTLTYVEGVALYETGIATHAWCVDAKGNVQDPTDSLPEYFGVPLSRSWVKRTLAEQKRPVPRKDAITGRFVTVAPYKTALYLVFEQGADPTGFRDERWAS